MQGAARCLVFVWAIPYHVVETATVEAAALANPFLTLVGG
jgi:hypothetical protein